MAVKKIMSLKISGYCGIAAPVIGLACIGLAISYAPWFSWTENYLSDLGGFPGDRPIYAAHGVASIFFNFGLMAAGILGCCLVIGIRESRILNSPLGELGTAFYLLDACALIGIGVFPESTGAPHTFFSMTFFVLVGFSLFFMGIAQIRSTERIFGWFTIGLFFFGLCAIPLFVTPKPVGSNAIAEMIPIISIALFSIAMGIKLVGLSVENE
jgi:hypothetical membrane protein